MSFKSTILQTSLVMALASVGTPALAQVCTTQLLHSGGLDFQDSVDRVSYRDNDLSTTSGWQTGFPGVSLSRKGGSFESETEAVGEKFNAVAAGDFNGDGFDDMITTALDPYCHIQLFINEGVDGDGDHIGFSAGGSPGSTGYEAQNLFTPNRCKWSQSATAADFNGDGRMDAAWFAMDNWNAGNPKFAHALIFMNQGNGGAGIPSFNVVDITALVDTINPAWHRVSDPLDADDWDGDGKEDIFFSSGEGNDNGVYVFLSTSTATTTSFAAPVNIIADSGLKTPGAGGGLGFISGCNPPLRGGGVNTMRIGDTDNDGDLDLVIGSQSQDVFHHWINDGTGEMYAGAPIPFPPAGATAMILEDFDFDGDKDLVVGRDGLNAFCATKSADVYYFANDGSGHFVMRPTPLFNFGADIDVGVAMQIDNDPAGFLEFLIIDGNNGGKYALSKTSIAEVFSLESSLYTLPVESNLAESFVSIDIEADATIPTGTTLVIYVSNDDGETWEAIDEDVFTEEVTHSFKVFGSALRFRAEFESEETALSTEEAWLAPGSKKSPLLRNLSYKIYGVDRREYSRSGLAYGVVEDGSGGYKEMIYSASFEYPSFHGHLRALDISNLGRALDELTEANSSVDVSTEWDGGAVVNAQSSSSRSLYAGYPATSGGTVNQKIAFASGNAGNPATSPLYDMMETSGVSEAQDVINFVRAGMQDFYKFRSPGHSSPTFVGPPIGDAEYLEIGFAADTYQDFRDNGASRAPMIYIGANDGFLRGFDAQDGDEEWGYVPYNLLSTVKEQMATNALGDQIYKHEFMIDGSLVVQDVYDRSVDEWKTVVISGQARGEGRLDRNYYFAVDVTDPSDPKPMWEFSDPYDAPSGGGASCSGDPNPMSCVADCDPEVCETSCDYGSDIYDQEPSTLDVVIEAEMYANNVSHNGGTNTWEEQQPGSPIVQNLALGGVASQLTTSGGRVASRAIDGNTDGDSSNGSVTRTWRSKDRWWEVDLQAVSAIDKIVIFNRTDAGSGNLRQFYVMVSETPFQGFADSDSAAWQIARPEIVWSTTVNSAVGTSLELNLGGVSGRYVRLHHYSTSTNRRMMLAEVEVYGTASSNPDLAALLPLSEGAYMRAAPFGSSSDDCYSTPAGSCGAELSYNFYIEDSDTYIPYYRVYRESGTLSGSDDSLWVRIDGGGFTAQHYGVGTGSWQWSSGSAIALDAGEHTMDLNVRENGARIDKIVLRPSSSSSPSGFGPDLYCAETCTPGDCRPDPICTPDPVPNGGVGNVEWSECGVGAELKCCPNPEDGGNLCWPMNDACPTKVGTSPWPSGATQIDTAMGETWSPPTIGKMLIGGQARFVAFFGSGYNNLADGVVGRTVYAVDAVTGTELGRWDLNDFNDAHVTIPNTVPGGPSVADTNNDGYVDRLYIGDLEGQLWKINMEKDATFDGSTSLINNWPSCVVFDAATDDDYTPLVREWAPIITRPAVAVIEDEVMVYFGTGGDDSAPEDVLYRFFGIRDTDSTDDCTAPTRDVDDLQYLYSEWVVGDGYTNGPTPQSIADARQEAIDNGEEPDDVVDDEGGAGDKYWADPVIVDGVVVYFASLRGSIESVNPCESLGGADADDILSRVYAYAIRPYNSPSAGRRYQPGDQVLEEAVQFKVRQAITTRNLAGASGALDLSDPYAGFSGNGGGYSTGQSAQVDLGTLQANAEPTQTLFQQFAPESGGEAAKVLVNKKASTDIRLRGPIRVLRWREVPL